LMAGYPKFNWKGERLPAGKAPKLSSAHAPKKEAPLKKEATPNADASASYCAPKKEAPFKKEATLNEEVVEEKVQAADKNKAMDAEAQGPIRVVVQRCNKASLLIDAEKDEWTSIERGLVFYVSFALGAKLDALPGACKSLLSAPLSSADKWSSDHSDAESVVGLVKAGAKQGLLIVPQASLVAKLERGDKKLKYYQQTGKTEAEQLYRGFIKSIRKVAEELITGEKERQGPTYEELQAMRAARAMVNPLEYFKIPDENGQPQPYSEWDERGVPTKDLEGVEIPKSQKKKLEKLYAVHVKKYEKAKEKGEVDGQSVLSQLPSAKAQAPAPEEETDDGGPLFADLANGLLEIRHGTFGGRIWRVLVL